MHSPDQNPENSPTNLPVRQGDKRQAPADLALSFREASFGMVPVVGIQPGALGRVLHRDSSSAATEALRDEEFLRALSEQMAYWDKSNPSGSISKVVNDIRVLQVVGEPGTVRAAARSLKWAVSDLVQDVAYRMENPEAAKPSPTLMAATPLHAATILNMIENAAAILDDRTLWDTFCSFFDTSSPTVAMKLKELESENSKIVEGAVKGLFTDIMDCAVQALGDAKSVRPLLTGNLVLKRLVHLIEARNLRAGSGEEALNVQDVLAVLFSKRLAEEMNSAKAEDRPLCALLKASSDSAFRLFEHTATNFSKLGPDDFPEPPGLITRASERDRNEQLGLRVQAAQTMMSCACKLWPEDYSELLKRRAQSSGVDQRLVYAEALGHGIAGDSGRASFVVAEYLALLQEPAKGPRTRRIQEVHRRAQASLKDLSGALVGYLGQGDPRRFETLSDSLRQNVLWDILVPACSSGGLDNAQRLGVLSFFEYEVRQRGPRLYTRPGVEQLLSAELVAALDPAQRSSLLSPIFESFTTAFSEESALKHDEDLLGNPALVRKYKPLVAAFGVDGLIFGLSEAAAKRDRHPLEAITLMRLIGESAGAVSHISPDARERVEEAVANYLIPLFRYYSGLGRGDEPGAAPAFDEGAVIRPAQEEAGEHDEDSLIQQALFENDASEEDDGVRPAISVENPHFISHATALCGHALRQFVRQSAVRDGVAALVLEKLESQGTQSLLTKYYAGKLGGRGIEQELEHRLAASLQEDSVSNEDVRAALDALRDLVRKRPELWPIPSQSPLYGVAASKLRERRALGFAYNPGDDEENAWDSRALDDALCLLTDYHAKLPGEMRGDVEVEILKTIKTWGARHGSAPRLAISDWTVLSCARKVLQQNANQEVKAYIALFATEALEGELRSGRSGSRRSALLRSEAMPFIEEALRHVGEQQRVKRSREDEKGELVRPRILALREILRKELGEAADAPSPKRTVEGTQIPRMDRRGPIDSDRRLLE